MTTANSINTVNVSFPIGWHVDTFCFNLGLLGNLPEAQRNTIRVFGEIPCGLNLQDILGKASIDIDHYDTIDIIITPGTSRVTVMAKNNEGVVTRRIDTIRSLLEHYTDGVQSALKH